MKYVTALVFLFPTICFSYTYEEAKQIVSQYTQLEVDSRDCVKYQRYDGMYFFRANRLIVCEENIRNNWSKDNFERVRLQTLVHEAVHLAQDCASGIDNSIIKPIEPNTTINPAMKKLIQGKYKAKWVDVEIEAWSYHKSHEPIELVKKHCKR